jgi:16S rRNA (uracil1498-N3)-methyltransferase
VNLLIVERHELDAGDRVTVAGVRARHLHTVLRATPGQPLRIGVLDGPVGSGVITAIDADTATLTCTFDADVPAVPAVDLLLALPRPKVLRRLWAQLAALGVGRILLTNAARVERNYFDTHVLDAATYRPLLVEGLQQARDTRLPVVSVHRSFRILIEDHLSALSDASTRLVADPSAADTIRVRLTGSPPGRVLLAVGPEGGWNQFERDLLAAHGFVAVTLGARTLRSDTAIVALLALVHDARSTVTTTGVHASGASPTRAARV